jgi:hypothetical protein
MSTGFTRWASKPVADEGAIADKREIRRIRVLEHVFGTAQDGNRGRRLPEDVGELAALQVLDRAHRGAQ